jgi:hypothetical protein
MTTYHEFGVIERRLFEVHLPDTPAARKWCAALDLDPLPEGEWDRFDRGRQIIVLCFGDLAAAGLQLCPQLLNPELSPRPGVRPCTSRSE